MCGGFCGVREDAGRFDDDLCADVGPRNSGRIPLGEVPDLIAVDLEAVFGRLYLAVVHAVVGVVLVEMGVGGYVTEVIDSDDFQGVRMALADGAQYLPADAAEAVDSNFRSGH